MEELKLFVDGGMADVDSFIDQCSEIVLDSSHDGDVRKENFKRVLEIFFSEAPTRSPTQKPTGRPSTLRPTYAPVSSETLDGPPRPPGEEKEGNPLLATPSAVPINSSNQQPVPIPNRPVAINLSPPKPNLSSNTITDVSIAPHVFSNYSWVWASLIVTHLM